ncbi:probable AP2-like ethylene-responsive transcription factor PLT1 [Coccomyxa sp. Obi]|nr:probable AP2-like ethylene-responsive transcription factor PLT1 [Coccomyxa sp. Obi]
MKAQQTWRQEVAKFLTEPSTDISINPYPGEEEPLGDKSHGGHLQIASEFLPGIAMPPPGKGVSKYRGVSWHKRNRKWRATCRDRIAKKSLHLGYFLTQEAAARAYDWEAIRVRGPSTRLNFKASDYGVKANPCGALWTQQSRNCTSLGGAPRCSSASTVANATKKRKSQQLHACCLHTNGLTAQWEAPNSKDSHTPTNEGACPMQLCHAECTGQPLGSTTPTKRSISSRVKGQKRALF